MNYHGVVYGIVKEGDLVNEKENSYDYGITYACISING